MFDKGDKLHYSGKNGKIHFEQSLSLVVQDVDNDNQKILLYGHDSWYDVSKFRKCDDLCRKPYIIQSAGMEYRFHSKNEDDAILTFSTLYGGRIDNVIEGGVYSSSYH